MAGTIPVQKIIHSGKISKPWRRFHQFMQLIFHSSGTMEYPKIPFAARFSMASFMQGAVSKSMSATQRGSSPGFTSHLREFVCFLSTILSKSNFILTLVQVRVFRIFFFNIFAYNLRFCHINPKRIHNQRSDSVCVYNSRAWIFYAVNLVCYGCFYVL